MSPGRSFGHLRDFDDFLALTDREREERSQALSVIGRARENGIPVEWVAADQGATMQTVRRWASEALQPPGKGFTYTTPEDDILRIRPMGVDEVVDLVEAHGSRQAAVADWIFATQWDRARGWDLNVERLRRLPARFNGRHVVRDPEVIDKLARRGEFNIDELYRELVG